MLQKDGTPLGLSVTKGGTQLCLSVTKEGAQLRLSVKKGGTQLCLSVTTTIVKTEFISAPFEQISTKITYNWTSIKVTS